MSSIATTTFEAILDITCKVLDDTPLKAKNTLFNRFFTSQEVLKSRASISSLKFCPGLLDVVESSTSPPIEFFKSLPVPEDLSSVWGIYILVLEKPGRRPKVYCGSATSSNSGLLTRFNQYVTQSYLPTCVEDAFEKDYTITHKGLLCWVPKPTAGVVPITRLLFIALEGMFSYLFWTMRALKGTYGMSHICPWDRFMLEYDGLCTHCALYETPRGDFDLTPEQLEAQAVEKEQKRILLKAENATNWHHKKMETDYDEYMGNAIARKMKSRANNPELDRIAERKRIAKQVADEVHKCTLCNKSYTTANWLKKHYKSAKHIRKVDEHKNPYRCLYCNLGYHNKSNLNRHFKALKHIAAVAEAGSIPPVRVESDSESEAEWDLEDVDAQIEGVDTQNE